ncbi:MAG: hypothetical protein WCF85_18825 [Rhodospirillaceae bacterium]
MVKTNIRQFVCKFLGKHKQQTQNAVKAQIKRLSMENANQQHCNTERLWWTER